MRHETHRVDFCVVGGGISGMCAAIAAARRGAKVALMQDRSILGGNASSEVRMWICGAQGPNRRETGIVEEMIAENLYRNPLGVWSIWDSITYGIVRFEPNITLLLNCSCNGIEMAGSGIRAVKGWQTTTETWHTVEAALFADCSGDSILAALSGAEFRIGREARDEFDEDIEPPVADPKTMGMSCLIQARETDRAQPYIPPKWAYSFPKEEDLPHRGHMLGSGTHCNNFWWLELGGEHDSIHDTEMLRDELLKIAFGLWDHIKNHGDHGAQNWALDWVGFLPGKRESRRYVGDHILTQNDVRAEGRFEDLVAYGGWSMDDHHPGGFRHPGKPTIFHPAPSPYGIPYRSLYSRNIENLLCAGRNISATHAAMSSTRVMATCATLGQAVGTAGAIGARDGLRPRGVYEQRLAELKQTLMDDDCYLPWNRRDIPALARSATLTASEGDPEPLRNGIDRPVGDEDNGWTGKLGSWVAYTFGQPERIRLARIAFDSNLSQRILNQPAGYPLGREPRAPMPTLVKAFRIEAGNGAGQWETIHTEKTNYQRFVRIPLDVEAAAIRVVAETTWGAESAHLFAFDVR